MEPRVTELTTDQDQIKKFRAYYDRTFRDLRILKRLTDSFPDEGSVSVKTIDVRDLANVTLAGVAKDNDSFVKVFGKLSDDTNEISHLHPEVRGQKPMQFTLNFQFGDEVENGN